MLYSAAPGKGYNNSGASSGCVLWIGSDTYGNGHLIQRYNPTLIPDGNDVAAAETIMECSGITGSGAGDYYSAIKKWENCSLRIA